MGAYDLFSNNAQTSVAASKTAVAAGTEETWTVGSSSGFPAASDAATPPTQFRIVDVADTSEIILVTDVSGTTWTVIRGAEDTTPVAHTGGFTITHIVTAGWLNRVEDRIPFYNVKGYGVVGDGTTDDAAALQDVIDMANAAGGGVVFLPPSDYKVTTTITVPSGVRLSGAGQLSSILGPTGSDFLPLLVLAGNDAHLEHLRIVGHASHTNTVCVQLGGLEEGSGVYERMRLTGVRIEGGSHYAVEAYGYDVFKDFAMVDCEITDSPTGVFFAATPSGGSQGLVFSRNTFRDLQNATPLGDGYVRALYLQGSDSDTTFQRVVISGNVFDELDDTIIPIQVNGANEVTITGNVLGAGSSKGISVGQCKRVAITGNSIYSQHSYAIELRGGNTFTITGNVVDLCDMFLKSTNASLATTDVTIANNTVTNTGFGYATGNAIVVNNGAARWHITGNLFRDSKSAGVDGVIQVGTSGGSDPGTDVTITGNVYHAVAATADVNFVTNFCGNRIRVSDNTVIIARNVSSSLNNFSAIYFGAASVLTHVRVDDNHLQMAGTLTATELHGIDDGGASSYSSTGWSVRRNTITGFNRGISFQNNTSATFTLQGNDTGVGNTSADQINGATRISGNI
ncbi:right-handed parallel beta-helix repeat-containing protein [Streptomyces sp. NPDC057686]|uniref:right-handed parallel beta-helix repeat-containing protein n=1 Tax=Streptomyces sp. NPDC057686 TaxID=3346212 RepID=UPI00367F5BC2